MSIYTTAVKGVGMPMPEIVRLAGQGRRNTSCTSVYNFVHMSIASVRPGVHGNSRSC